MANVCDPPTGAEKDLRKLMRLFWLAIWQPAAVGSFKPTGILMNARVAGDHYDLCGGSGELSDQDGKMHPCVGCLGCGGPQSEKRLRKQT